MNIKIIIFIILSFIIWRFLLFIPLWASDQKLNYRSGYEYTNIAKVAEPAVYSTLNKLYLAPFANFDGIHYLTIAGNGYTNNFGFFPLYPMAIKALSILFLASNPFDLTYFFSGFLISNITFFLSLIIFYKLLLLDYKEKQTKQILLSVLVFPTSFFFGSLYSESLFLLFLFLSFYFARKKQWVLASICGFGLTLTRLVGIFIFPILLYEYFRVSKEPLSKFFKSGLWTIPSGLIGYSIYNYISQKDFFYFIHAHGNLFNNRTVDSIVLFPQTIYRYIKILILNSRAEFEWWIALVELGSFVFAIFALYFAWKKKVRLSYILFSAFAVLIPASSGTFSALPRYILAAFPIFIVLGISSNKWIRTLYFGVSIALLFALLFFFSKGYFIA